MYDLAGKDKQAVLQEMAARSGKVADQAEWRKVFPLGGYTGDSDAAVSSAASLRRWSRTRTAAGS